MLHIAQSSAVYSRGLHSTAIHLMSDATLVNYRHTGIYQCVYSAYTEAASTTKYSLLPPF
jgi:hypothetical protein